jgi:hypothetical protein
MAPRTRPRLRLPLLPALGVLTLSLLLLPIIPGFAQQTHEITARAFAGFLRERPQTLPRLDYAQREALFDRVLRHPVAALAAIQKYDPQGFIGFCFGRAMAVHLAARDMGVHTEAIRKVFIVGALRENGAIVWRFHVTTVVRGDDHQWYAIDPIVGAPYTLQQWIHLMRRTYDKQSEAFFYMTPATAVLPDLRLVPAIDAETGAHLIELSFNPAGRTGFVPRPQLDSRLYELTTTAAGRFFTGTATPPPEGFSFADITINGATIGYNGYFHDLVASFGRPAATLISARPDRATIPGTESGSHRAPHVLSTRPVSEPAPTEHLGIGLGSMRFASPSPADR